MQISKFSQRLLSRPHNRTQDGLSDLFVMNIETRWYRCKAKALSDRNAGLVLWALSVSCSACTKKKTRLPLERAFSRLLWHFQHGVMPFTIDVCKCFKSQVLWPNGRTKFVLHQFVSTNLHQPFAVFELRVLGIFFFLKWCFLKHAVKLEGSQFLQVPHEWGWGGGAVFFDFRQFLTFFYQDNQVFSWAWCLSISVENAPGFWFT